MSRRLQDFLTLLTSPEKSRDETEMGSFVTWLRRRNALLKHLQTSDVISILRRATHHHAERDEVIFHQLKQRESVDSIKFFIILRGSVSMFVNPFLSQGKTSRASSQSAERTLLSFSPAHSSLVRFLVHPSSAASRKSSVSWKSQPTPAPVKEDPDSDASDAESDVSIPAEVTSNGEVNVPEVPRQTAEHSPASVPSKSSTTRSVRSKLGKFIVKYEKGKYFGEDAVLDEESCYSASIIADEATELIVLDEENFNRYVKQQHEREVTKLTNFVDVHPFFCDLPLYSKGVIQISLKPEHHLAGSFIAKQGEQLSRLIFIISGSAEVIVEPGKHRFQYPDLWPFETSDDVYFRECHWLRESRRRMYSRKYEYKGEISRRASKAMEQRHEISVCAVQNKEVIGVTEFALGLETHIQSLRCLHDCEVFTLSLRPFRRIARRKNPELLQLVNAYVHSKLQLRLTTSLGDHVPLFRSLMMKIEKEVREKSYNGMNTKNIEKIREHERVVLQMLQWFKLDKCPLLLNRDPGVIKLKEQMKKKAKRRENIRQRTHEKPFFRSGCLATVKPEREPRSLHQLRDPMNEVILKLRMEGTFVEDSDELEEILMRYTETPVGEDVDISSQQDKVLREQYNVFRYRRHGNRLIRKFQNMLAAGNQRNKTPATVVPPNKTPTTIARNKTPTTVLLKRLICRMPVGRFFLRQLATSQPRHRDTTSPGTVKTFGISRMATSVPDSEAWDRYVRGDRARTRTTLPDSEDRYDRAKTRTTVPDSEAWDRYDRYDRAMTRTTTNLQSRASTHRSLQQFERRSVTPDTLTLKIRDFHERYGGRDEEIRSLPSLKKADHDTTETEDSPIPGGKVFVTMAPCVSCSKNVLLKNHAHVRCQMLHALPMDKINDYTEE